MRIAITGAGLSGAVLAHELTRAGHEIEVFESRSHIAGNCHTYRDPGTDVMVHAYGPHVFHTNNERVWNYMQGFGEFMPYIQRTKAIAGGKVYSLPINLHTINQFFGRAMSPRDARDWIAGLADTSIGEPQNFEEQALKFVGRELYEAFFKGYTIKQWGRDPTEIPASVLKRLPLRFNYDDNYFDHKFQGIPRHGYTAIVEKMLKGVPVLLKTPLTPEYSTRYEHVFYSGPLDAWFNYEHGRLAYRTLDFKPETVTGDGQGAPVLNYCDQDVPYTRRTEHKHFASWEPHDKSLIFTEYSRECEPGDEPYYPIRLARDKAQLAQYEALAASQKGITFIGRLGTYRYLDMDMTIAEALAAADKFIGQVR